MAQRSHHFLGQSEGRPKTGAAGERPTPPVTAAVCKHKSRGLLACHATVLLPAIPKVKNRPEK